MRISRSIFLTTLLMGVSSGVQLSAQYSHEESPQSSFVPDWVPDAIFYQIFPERFANGDTSNDPAGTEAWGGQPKTRNFFGGDLQGIIDHLDYLSQLGVNCLYLNPIFQSGSNHKYNTDDYMKIDSSFGNETVFKRLIDSCHTFGIRVILDGVFNHTGTGFFAFRDVKKNGAKSRYRDWYNFYGFPVGAPSKPNYECWWGYGELPKLMTTNPDVRDYLFRVTEHWMKFGIDGWRLDVPNEIPHKFWIDWRKLVKSLNPDAYIVGEIWDDASPWLQGNQFDAVMNYLFRSACLDFFAYGKSTVLQFDSALADIRSRYPDEVNYAMQNLLGSHDTERLLTVCSNDKEKMKLALLFQMTYEGAPMLYYGDEIGMTGGKDPGCRHTMLWDPMKQDTLLFEYVKGLIKLRKENRWLRRGTFETLVTDEASNVYVFMRRGDSGQGIVAMNNSTQMQSVKIPLEGNDCTAGWRKVWSGDRDAVVRVGKDAIEVTIPPISGLVLTGGS